MFLLPGYTDASCTNSGCDCKQEPYVSTMVGSGKALNKLAWDKDGKRTAIGSSDGRVYIYELGDVAHPKPEDWHLLQKNISEMISNQENPNK